MGERGNCKERMLTQASWPSVLDAFELPQRCHHQKQKYLSRLKNLCKTKYIKVWKFRSWAGVSCLWGGSDDLQLSEGIRMVSRNQALPALPLLPKFASASYLWLEALALDLEMKEASSSSRQEGMKWELSKRTQAFPASAPWRVSGGTWNCCSPCKSVKFRGR